jgi:hypothetical protein
MFDRSQQLQRRAFQDGTKQASMFAVAISFICITTIVMGLRLHVRLRLVQGGLGMDDREYFTRPCWDTNADLPDLLLVGYVFTIALSIATMLCGWYGVGTHGTMHFCGPSTLRA